MSGVTMEEVEPVIAVAVPVVAVAGLEEAVPPAAVVVQAVPAGAQLNRQTSRSAELYRVVSAARPVVRTTRAGGKRGIPVLHCSCDPTVPPCCEKLCYAMLTLVAYCISAALVIFGAGLIATVTASTDLYGAGLGFVSWLLCMMFFCLLAACCGVAADNNNDDNDGGPGPAVGIGCMMIGVIASVLCIILSHPMNRLNYLEESPALMEGIFPLGAPSLNGTAIALEQANFGEVSFASGSFVDTSLGFAVLEDVSKSCGEDCNYPATVAVICAAPVVPSCGEAASVSHTLCNSTTAFCSTRAAAAPTCRSPPQFAPSSQSSGTGRALQQSNPTCDDDAGEQCGACFADCDDDDECAPGLKCWERETRTLRVPGCDSTATISDEFGGSEGDDQDDDYCYDPEWKDRNQFSLAAPFWVYIDADQAIELDDPFADHTQFCQSLWRHKINEDYEDMKGKGLWIGSIDSVGNGGGDGWTISAHPDPLLDEHTTEMLKSYRRGLAINAGGTPVFLKWQPEVGYQEERLWAKIRTWCIILGLGWLPLLVCLGGLAAVCN